MDNQLPTCERGQESKHLIEPGRLKQLIENTDDLTMLPVVAMEAIEMANDPDCSVHDFARIIERDAGLVTDILSLSNSAVYQTSCEIKGIHHAAVVIGLSQCKNLVISSSMKPLAKNLPPSVEWSRNLLWRHGIQTATIASSLNRTLKLGFDGEEFSGSMIHDMGRLLIAAAAPDVFEVVDCLSFDEGDLFLAAEQALMGTDHCEIGAWFAETGQLPSSLVDVIRFHHTPAQSAANELLVSLVSVADEMANHWMRAGTSDHYDPAGNTGWALLLTTASENVVVGVDSVIEAAFRAVEDAVEEDDA